MKAPNEALLRVSAAFTCLALACSILLLPFTGRSWARYCPGMFAVCAGLAASLGGVAAAGQCWRYFQACALLIATTAGLQFLLGATLSRGRSLQAAVDAIGVLAMLVAMERVVRSKRQYESWMAGITAAALMVATAGAVLHLALPHRAFGIMQTLQTELWGPFANRNMYGLFVALATPASALLAAKARRPEWLIAPLLLAGAVVASGSRSGAAILAVEWCVIVCLAVRRRYIAWKSAALAGAIALAILAACFDAHLLRTRLIAGDFTSTRGALYLSALHVIGDGPWVGTGLGTFALAYPAHAGADFGALVDHAHNDWLEWAAEGGLWLPFSLALLGGLILRRSWKHPMVLAFLALFQSSLLDYPLHRPTFALFAIAFIALGLSQRVDEISARQANPSLVPEAGSR